MPKRTFLALMLVFVLSLFIAVPSPAAGSSALGPDTFEEILDYIQTRHIDSPDSGTLIRGAIEGLIDTLNDPYTEYLPPDLLEDFSRSLEGGYVGVGIQLEPGEGYPRVIGTIDNTPARGAGIKPGDLVIKVDGADVANEPLGKIVQRIRGPEGSKVRLTFRREGMEDFEVELARANINIPTVNGKVLDEGTGYIRISTFGTGTAGEFRNILDGLLRQGAGKLILDLRDNPGGILHSAVEISSNFIEPGRVVVSTVDRKGKRQEYLAEGTPVARGLPVVILVNQNSASAAEILAAALQDYGAAVLIGERTYGKGTVQTVIPLKAGGALKLTLARYHTPRDRVIDGTGLCPDVQVLDPELQLATAERYLERPEKNTVVMEVGKNEALVNGKPVHLRHAAVERSGAAYVPLRFVFEALGYRVDWQADSGSIRVTGYNTETVFYPGGWRLTSGGRSAAGTEPLLFVDGAGYIPVSVLSLSNINVKHEESRITIEK